MKNKLFLAIAFGLMIAPVHANRQLMSGLMSLGGGTAIIMNNASVANIIISRPGILGTVGRSLIQLPLCLFAMYRCITGINDIANYFKNKPSKKIEAPEFECLFEYLIDDQGNLLHMRYRTPELEQLHSPSFTLPKNADIAGLENPYEQAIKLLYQLHKNKKTRD